MFSKTKTDSVNEIKAFMQLKCIWQCSNYIFFFLFLSTKKSGKCPNSMTRVLSRFFSPRHLVVWKKKEKNWPVVISHKYIICVTNMVYSLLRLIWDGASHRNLPRMHKSSTFVWKKSIVQTCLLVSLVRYVN